MEHLASHLSCCDHPDPRPTWWLTDGVRNREALAVCRGCGQRWYLRRDALVHHARAAHRHATWLVPVSEAEAASVAAEPRIVGRGFTADRDIVRIEGGSADAVRTAPGHRWTHDPDAGVDMPLYGDPAD